MAHKHSVYDTDYHFPIDPVTRTIKNLCGKITLIQHDHNSERLTFEIPRYVDGHDMSLCNQSEVHYNNISNGQTNLGVYPISDLQVDPTDDKYVICSWLISHNATRLVGHLAFVLRFACVSDDGTVEYAWNTIPYSEVKVATSIYNSDAIIDAIPDGYIQPMGELEITANGTYDAAEYASVTVNVEGSGSGPGSDFEPIELDADLIEALIDFEYTDNGNGTATLTAWKGTLNGSPSTEIVVPDDSRIIL